jgi:hypothetical protein
MAQQQQQQQEEEAPASPAAPRVQYMRVADPGSVQSLLGAGVADADAVMLGPALSAKAAPGSIEADALVTSTVLAIQQALQTVSWVPGPIQAARSHLGACWQQEQQRRQQKEQQQRSRLHVVAVVSSYSVRRALQTFLSSVLLRVNFSYEICLMEEFAAGMLVSVSEGARGGGQAACWSCCLCWPLLGCSFWSVIQLVWLSCSLDMTGLAVCCWVICLLCRWR